jgi:hypothetical protein
LFVDASACSGPADATIPNLRGCSLGRAVWAAERVLDDLQRLALRAPGRVEFFDEAAERLKRTIPFDGA